MSTSHLDGAYALGGLGTLRAYLLAIDYDQEALWTLSSTTLGASFVGKAPLGNEISLSYRLELALYDADAFATDTDKIFLWTQWGF